MFKPNPSRNDRLPARGFRMPAAVAGVAVLGLSLLLSVGPALGAGNGNGANGNSSGAGGNGTTGNVKVHDAGTGVETSGGDNEPHVCDFWLGFTLDFPFEAGTWVVVSWAPTGDGSTVASGVYDTAGDGIDSSGVIAVPAGHYRVEWAATGATVSKKKTFWVDAGCDETAPPEDESPVEASASPAEESSPPIDESPAEELVSPVEESQEAQSSGDESPGDESPAEEVESTVEDSPVEDPAPPTDEPTLPEEHEVDLADESVVDEPVTPGDQTVADGEGGPADEPPATDDDTSVEEQPGQAAGPGATNPGVPPMQHELDGIGVDADPTMSDTAVPTPSMPSGLPPAFIALLLMLVVAAARRGTRGEIGA
jgi:hypothetical protein